MITVRIIGESPVPGLAGAPSFKSVKIELREADWTHVIEATIIEADLEAMQRILHAAVTSALLKIGKPSAYQWQST